MCEDDANDPEAEAAADDPDPLRWRKPPKAGSGLRRVSAPDHDLAEGATTEEAEGSRTVGKTPPPAKSAAFGEGGVCGRAVAPVPAVEAETEAEVGLPPLGRECDLLKTMLGPDLCEDEDRGWR